ncbi:MAG: DUF4394 domain-containing protein [Pseudomonadota bacterium]
MQARKSLVLTALAASLLTTACSNTTNNTTMIVTPPPVPGNVLLDANRLAYLDFAVPGSSLSLLGTGTVTGLAVNDTLVSIDRRPQNGFLYGLGYNSLLSSVTLYVIHPETLVATSLGLAGGFTTDGTIVDPIGNGMAGTRFEMDFNPAVDRLRVINSMGQNFRMDPNTGLVLDGNFGGAVVAGTNMDGDLNGGGANAAQGTAYVNNVANNGGVTTQYTVIENPGMLFIQNMPNAGTLTLPLALSPTVNTILGFDIAPGVNTATANAAVTTGTGYLLLRRGAATAESLATVNLVDGAVSSITAITGGAGARGLAVQAPASMAVIGLSGDGLSLVRFAAATPNTITTVAISGVPTSESLVGIDFRPATGQLYALGVNHMANNGTIYRLDPQNGVATVIGTAGSIAFVSATDGVTAVDLPDPATAGYGFDFNPAVDRIRVTTSTGLNFRMNQLTGTPVDGNAAAGVNPDGGINNNGITGVSGAAYTNSVAGTAVTTLYALSDVGSQLTIQNMPNDGTQTVPLLIREGATTLAFTSVNGFDIPSDVRISTNNAAVTSGNGFAALTVGGVTGLYRINLATGGTTKVGNIGNGALALRGLTVGQTHAR